MDTKSLTLLVEILDAGNLSEAARRLKMTRANVSYHLTQLERSVGMQLVRRTTRHVEATEIGLKLYQHGRAIREELVAARESIDTLGKTPQGRVRLSVPSGYGQFVMQPWLLSFKQTYPDIVLDVLFENSVEDLLRDEVDIAVRIMSEPPQNLVARELGQVRYVACASHDYVARRGLPQAPAALTQLPVVSAAVIGRPLRLSAYLDAQPREHVVLEPTVVSRNYAFLRAAVQSGLGIGVLPDYVVHEDLARGELVQVLPQWRLSIFGRAMYMLYMPNRHPPRALAMMIEYILACAHAEHEGRPGLLAPAGVARAPAGI
ncbi:LysR family transcriptional regulator [Bordetella genomosp. 1]|uniref:LysR family transcriptional regulator n=1 Tax=Bordetella genomosp. 1 TaxID=1395607 RepID=A0ABX4F2V7_9BORD|nr:LysR family transcriptional regulator [Bordetella genomosp. 1]MDQ8035663.1 LysR substrate-binding domain-containing protein [Bordetella sp.]OZI68088.1 LysR family transcriptional regulator [Bordetella genomosp. 1]